MEHLKKEKILGFPLPVVLLFCVIVFAAMYTGALGGDMMSTITFTLVLGLVLNRIGDAIPYANKYLGAGLLLCMFVPSYMVYRGVITEQVVTNTANFFSFSGVQYMTFFIVLLMTNSMLNIEKKVLLQCIARFIPLSFITVIGAILGTALVGKFFGVSLGESISNFVLPIMGSGTSGAAALSQIYNKASGLDAESYYGTVVVMVVLATTLCIFFAALLNLIGSVFPKLTGDKNTLLRAGKKGEEISNSPAEKMPEASLSDVISGLVLAGVVYAAAGICSKIIPEIKGVELHQYAYMILILIAVNYMGIVPDHIKSGLKRLTAACVNLVMPMIGVCIGMTLMSWESFTSAFTAQTLIMTIACIVSACLTAAVFGHLLGMYAVDSAVTAALCQADMGGGADIGILVPSDRMGLIAYATVASRIGYAIILIMASILFPLIL